MRCTVDAPKCFFTSFMSAAPLIERMTFRPSLDLQFHLLLPDPFLLAEGLVASGQILLGPALLFRAVPGLRLMGEISVPQMRPRQRHEIGAPGMENGVDLRRFGDGADRHRRHL